MLSREAADIKPTSKKIDTGKMPWNRGDPRSDLSRWKFVYTPSAVIQPGGRVGLSSVPHGKLHLSN